MDAGVIVVCGAVGVELLGMETEETKVRRETEETNMRNLRTILFP